MRTAMGFWAGGLKAAALSVLLSTAASASGFYLGDNGAATLINGGAFTGLADDLTAMQHNPAGLAQLDGFSALLDGSLLNHSVTFSRLDPGFDPNAPPASLANPATNTGGPFPSPFLGVSYGINFESLKNRTLTIAIGVYGPPAVGHYKYNEPNYEKTDPVPPAQPQYVERPNKFAPQRYGQVESNILIVYPTISAAFEVHRTVLLGASLQVATSHFYLRQSITSQLFTPKTQGQEDPSFDSQVTVDVAGRPVVTGIFGALVRPIDSLGIGLSVRPPIRISATGQLGLELGESPKAAGASLQCAQADGSRASCPTSADGKQVLTPAELSITLPLELRAGVNYRPWSRLGLSVDFVYQGWQALQQIVLAPKDVTLSTAGGEPKAVEPFNIEKKWLSAWSIRAGVSFDIIRQLSVSAGYWYESGGIPLDHFSIDFVHPARSFITGGVAAHLGPVDIIAGVAVSPSVRTVVASSEVRAGSTDPQNVPGNIIGTGVYDSSAFIATLGLRLNLGGEKFKARRDARFGRKVPEPADDAPTPAPAPAPAAPSGPESAPQSAQGANDGASRS